MMRVPEDYISVKRSDSVRVEGEYRWMRQRVCFCLSGSS